MEKRQVIDRIMQLNPSAMPEFLAGFSMRELSDYLRQLSAVIHNPPHRRRCIA